MRTHKIDFEETEGRWRSIAGLPSESSTASESTFAQASSRGSHIKGLGWIHTANKVATAACKSPGQTPNRSDTESRNTDPKALREKTN